MVWPRLACGMARPAWEKEDEPGAESDDTPWDELEPETGEVLPDEILGWFAPAEVNQRILRSWIQYFGYPKCFKLGTKGGHRGRDLKQWGDTHTHARCGDGVCPYRGTWSDRQG